MMEKRNAAGLTEAEFLKAYKPGDYERPSVTVDIMVTRVNSTFTGLQILLIKRKDHPYIGQWALPGGFVDIHESAHAAACRELEEETGLKDVYLEQLYTMSQPNRDPRMRVIDIAYTALLPYGAKADAQAGDDASEALWFDVAYTDEALVLINLEHDVWITYDIEHKRFQNGKITVEGFVPVCVGDAEKLAFDHANIILEGLARLRNKVEYTDVAFNLLPDAFTLPDLQKVFEIILGEPLYRTNFRAKTKDKVVPTGESEVSLSGKRVAKLYEYIG